MACTEKCLLLVGGGGHCKSVLDCVRAAGGYARIGIVDRRPVTLPGACYAGRDEDLIVLRNSGWNCAIVTLGSVGCTDKRRQLFALLKGLGYELPTVIEASAIVSSAARIGKGVFIGKHAVVNADASVGDCAIINTGGIVEHDAHVGAFAHISPGAVLCGGVQVGEGAHVGANASVIQGVVIGQEALVGAGSVVVGDIQPNMIAYGNPCCEVRKK